MSFSSESKESAELFHMPRNSRCSWLSLVSSAKSGHPDNCRHRRAVSHGSYSQGIRYWHGWMFGRVLGPLHLFSRVSDRNILIDIEVPSTFPLTISRTVWSSTSRCFYLPLAPCDHVDDFPIKRAREISRIRKASLRRLLIHRSLSRRLPADVY